MSNRQESVERIDPEALESLAQYTFPQILSRQADRLGDDRIAIREKAFGIWQAYSWNDYLRYTKLTALGLHALGIKRNENVGLILDNHPEWLFSELEDPAAARRNGPLSGRTSMLVLHGQGGHHKEIAR